MADHANRTRLALEQLDHVLRGFLGGLGVVRLNRGDRDVGLNARVEGDNRDVLGLDLAEQISGGIRVQGGETDGGRAGVQSGLQLVGLLGHLGLILRADKADLVAQLLASLLGTFLHGLPEAVLEALGDQVDGLGAITLDSLLLPVLLLAGGVHLRGTRRFGLGGASGGIRRGRACSHAQGQGADGSGGDDTSDGAHWCSFRGVAGWPRLSGE